MPVVMEQCFYSAVASRLDDGSPPMSDPDTVEIVLKLTSTTTRRRPTVDDPIPDTGRYEKVAYSSIGVNFSSDKGIKQKRHESYYRRHLSAILSDLGVPESIHSQTLDILFEEVEASVSPELPILLTVYHIRHQISNHSPTDPSRSAIEGLERVRLDRALMEERQTCAICLVDYVEQDVVDQLMLTRMPCAHYFHGDCIRKWLQLSHLCPMCRYSDPCPLSRKKVVRS